MDYFDSKPLLDNSAYFSKPKNGWIKPNKILLKPKITCVKFFPLLLIFFLKPYKAGAVLGQLSRDSEAGMGPFELFLHEEVRSASMF